MRNESVYHPGPVTPSRADGAPLYFMRGGGKWTRAFDNFLSIAGLKTLSNKAKNDLAALRRYFNLASNLLLILRN